MQYFYERGRIMAKKISIGYLVICLLCTCIPLQTSAGNEDTNFSILLPMENVNVVRAEYTSDASKTKVGYHFGKEILCEHTPDDNVIVYVKMKGLTNTKTELKNNFVVTGAGKSKFKYELQTGTKTITGTGAAKVSTNTLNIKVTDLDGYLAGTFIPIAYPYLSENAYSDGKKYVGYTYIKQHYSYCRNLKKWIYLGSEHYWLGTAHGDVGQEENHTFSMGHFLTPYERNTGTIRYHANGGAAKAGYEIGSNIVKKDGANLTKAFHYESTKTDLTNVGTLLSREGYHVDAATAWRIGSVTGSVFTQVETTDLTKLKNLIKTETGRTYTLYANWIPNLYTVQYQANGGMGTMTNSSHTYDTSKALSVVSFIKKGHQFTGWNTKADGTGKAYQNNASVKNLTTVNNATVTLYAQWIPITYNIKYGPNGGTGTMANSVHTYGVSKALSAIAYTKKGYKFIGWKSGKDGKIYADKQSVLNLGENQNETISFTAQWKENMYKIRFHENGGVGSMEDDDYIYDEKKPLTKNVFTKEFYKFKNWNSKADGTGISYQDMQEVTNLTDKDGEIINLYAQWEKYLVNVAYSGNGQTEGKNMLENNVWLGEAAYLFQPNTFQKTKEETKKNHDTGEEYQAEVTYNYMGWGLRPRIGSNEDDNYSPESNISAELLHSTAKTFGSLTVGKPIEDTEYVPVSGIQQRKAIKSYQEEFINVFAIWNSSPTIIPSVPNDIPTDDGKNDSSEDDLEIGKIKPNQPVQMDGTTPIFMEGQKVAKEGLISHLQVDDIEDGNLIDQIRIIKIRYSDSKKKAGYEKEWEDDIPQDYKLDTYFEQLEKDEIVEHYVTYIVTDMDGFETIVELPVKVKYNYPPKIKTYERWYYFKEDANRGVIKEDAIIKLALALDKEDGKAIENELKIIDFKKHEFTMQTTPRATFPVEFEVYDSLGKKATNILPIMVVDADAVRAEQHRKYVRFISHEFMDTLEPNSIWREPKNWKHLEETILSETPVDTWYFTHEDVKKIQDWITEEGWGNWKIGQEANKEFYKLFKYCNRKEPEEKPVENEK